MSALSVEVIASQSIVATWFVSAWLVVVGLSSHYLANSTALHWKPRCLVVTVLFAPVLLAGANEIGMLPTSGDLRLESLYAD